MDGAGSRVGRLAGEVAFPTGAGAGIARPSARIFAREGACENTICPGMAPTEPIRERSGGAPEAVEAASRGRSTPR